MNFLEIAQKRYAAKAYRNEKISEAKIKELAEILRLAPSSVNSQPWKFAIIGDEALKADLAAHSFFNEQKILQRAEDKRCQSPCRVFCI